MLKSGSAMLAMRAGIANSSVGFVQAYLLGSDIDISFGASELDADADEKKAAGRSELRVVRVLGEAMDSGECLRLIKWLSARENPSDDARGTVSRKDNRWIRLGGIVGYYFLWHGAEQGIIIAQGSHLDENPTWRTSALRHRRLQLIIGNTQLHKKIQQRSQA